MDLTIYTDGGSLNNPGPAASSYLIYQGKKLVHKGVRFLGVASNNVAEYTALIMALEKVLEIQKDCSVDSIACFADSQLVVSQLSGKYKIKHPDMKKLASEVKVLEMRLGVVPSYTYIPREKNAEADGLVKEVLLGKTNSGSGQA